MVKHDTFASRVQSLRDTWVERRQVGRLASAHDFDSQFRLLVTLHEWASAAVVDIAEVYGETPSVTVSPLPEHSDETPAFSIVVDAQHSLTLSLAERRRMGAPRWHLSISISAAGSAHSAANAGPERRNGQWTRTRLEDLILSLLGAYERSLSGETGERSTLTRLDALQGSQERNSA